ncbi:MAG: ProQ/FinO family protein [Legionellaceae bacterium]|nr:ProQ/FinO family protein [Legionellaceae bacterium]
MRKQELHPRTAILNKKEKNRCRLARLQALAWLAKQFPEAFCNERRIRPLKIGIMDDVIAYAEEAAAHGISRSKLREAVVVFTRRVDYLTCLKAREMRVDLHGNPCGNVSEDDAERAAGKIRKRVEKSARNARKLLAGKAAVYYPKSDKHALTETAPPDVSAAHAALPEQLPKASFYPERSPAYSSQNATPAKSAASIVVKHKPTRSYDPDVVARLKAKLGLSRSHQNLAEANAKND